MPKKKPYRIEVSVKSISTVNGEEWENQDHLVIEGAKDEAELTMKCFEINAAVTEATEAVMKKMAEAAGFPTEIPSSKPPGRPRK